MTNEAISKALFKVIEPGKCFHEQKLYTDAPTGCYICKHCGETIPWLWKNHNPDYFTKSGFVDAWLHAKKDLEFIDWFLRNYVWYEQLVPDKFAGIYLEYLENNKV